MRTMLALAIALALLPAAAHAEDASKPLAEPVLEAPTLHSLGVTWIIQGDDNKNARVEVGYRAALGEGAWIEGYPLFRVEKGAQKMAVPEGAWLFAGSILLLRPDTPYEIRLALTDPDGGTAERVLRARTLAEPVVPADAPRRHVWPGDGGGSGSEVNPFRGLDAAQASAKPGDVFLLHPGVYEGTFEATKSGEPGRPIVWMAAGDGEAILDGQGKAEKRPGRAVSAGDIHDVWFEGLTIRNADYGLVGHRSTRLVIRRCHIYGVDYGITWTNNDRGTTNGFFVADNLIEGPSTWPRTQGIENARGIQATGTGHVICYNRIRRFADAIDTFGSRECAAIDIHNNEISECTDDGIEMDYSERNTRCFFNRCTNVYQGISEQPIHGGPVYVFRNALYNVCVEPFKLHNSPSGALIFHNTCVKKGVPLILMTGEAVHHCVTRNNLFIGTGGNYAYETTAPMQECDFDYDGFGGGPYPMFLKWNGARFRTLDEAKAKAPVYRHAVLVDAAAAFASGALPPADQNAVAPAPDLRLKPGTAAIDAGEPLPGLSGPITGRAPDLGAYELGVPLPHYGPR